MTIKIWRNDITKLKKIVKIIILAPILANLGLKLTRKMTKNDKNPES
jgi:hypothetical protein